MRSDMTSLQRVLTTIGHHEPDRVPYFLLLSHYGAKELGLPIEDYFSAPKNVIEAQLRMQAKYGHDCLYAFFYASIEIEAWGGETLFRSDGSPNAGAPIIRQAAEIASLEPPRVDSSGPLAKVLATIEQLKTRAGSELPIVGVVMSPFSVPVMQMGFDKYIELIYEQPDLFARLMRVNEEFCVAWANAQLAAGATAITYFDPVSSLAITPYAKYRETGFKIARETIARIKGPTAIHLASATCQGIIGDLAQLGSPLIGVSTFDDLAQIKAEARGRLALLGNLNGIEMRRWTPQQAEAAVRDAIAKAGPGGGFILSDNHGEIPCQVPEDVLLAIAEAVRVWGRYPLAWVDQRGK